MLTKDAIIHVEDLDYEDEEVPEWGGTVRIRCMTGSERDSFEAAIYKIEGGNTKVVRDNFRATLLARCLIDENGNRLFSDKEINQLGKKNSKIISRLFEKAQKINGLTTEDQEELLKNFKGEEESGSISSSPKNLE